MNSLYVLSALMLAATSPALTFTMWTMTPAITCALTWSRGVIAAIQKRRGAISYGRRDEKRCSTDSGTPPPTDDDEQRKPRPVKGCDENGMPLDPNHHWNREPSRQRRTEKSPATEPARTARTLYARGRI